MAWGERAKAGQWVGLPARQCRVMLGEAMCWVKLCAGWCWVGDVAAAVLGESESSGRLVGMQEEGMGGWGSSGVARMGGVAGRWERGEWMLQPEGSSQREPGRGQKRARVAHQPQPSQCLAGILWQSARQESLRQAGSDPRLASLPPPPPLPVRPARL